MIIQWRVIIKEDQMIIRWRVGDIIVIYNTKMIPEIIQLFNIYSNKIKEIVFYVCLGNIDIFCILSYFTILNTDAIFNSNPVNINIFLYIMIYQLNIYKIKLAIYLNMYYLIGLITSLFVQPSHTFIIFNYIVIYIAI